MSSLSRLGWAGLASCLVAGCWPRSSAPAARVSAPVLQPSVTAAPVAEPPLVLASVQLPEQPERRLEVQVERCDAPDGCPFSVALVHAERVIARQPLDWAKALSEPAFLESQPDWGAGDPLDPQPVRAAVTGDASAFIATIARPVALAPGVTGLLVDQLSSVAPVKRAHHVLVARGDALDLAWSHAEDEGPTWSSSAVVEIEPEREGVAFFRGLRLASVEAGAADALEAELVAWSVVDRKLRVSSLHDTLHAVVLGPIKGVPLALALRDHDPACLGRFSIMASASLPEAKLKGTLLVQLGVSAEAAARALAAARSCAPKTAGRAFAFQ